MVATPLFPEDHWGVPQIKSVRILHSFERRKGEGESAYVDVKERSIAYAAVPCNVHVHM